MAISQNQFCRYSVSILQQRIRRQLENRETLQRTIIPVIEVHRMVLSDYSGEGRMFYLPWHEHIYAAPFNLDIHVKSGNPLASRVPSRLRCSS